MTCDVCGLVDPFKGSGDGIGSCDCCRCDCGVASGSSLCTCPPEEEGPACWELAPGGGIRCGLVIDHEGEHRFSIWESR